MKEIIKNGEINYISNGFYDYSKNLRIVMLDNPDHEMLAYDKNCLKVMAEEIKKEMSINSEVGMLCIE